MNNVDRLVADADRLLHDAGYPLVQRLARVRSGDPRVQLLAWSADSSGALVPWAVVEVKASGRPETALPRLRRASDVTGAVDQYVVTSDGWNRALPGLRTLSAVDGPKAPPRPGGVVRDANLLAELLGQRVAAESSAAPVDRGSRLELLEQVLEDAARSTTLETAGGDVVAIEPASLWDAYQACVADFVERNDLTVGEYSTPTATSGAMARLVGNHLSGTVLDPFCGVGSTLAATIDRAAEEGVSVEARGIDLDPRAASIAHARSLHAPRTVQIEEADSFQARSADVDVVVSVPPFGLRLDEPYVLMNGSETRNGELAAVDLCIGSLKAGGRAVLQVTPMFVSDGREVGLYRDYLSNDYRIAALIGCPPGSAGGTSIRTVLMVVDNAQPTETFVAQLADDWEMQLSNDGPTMKAALAHIDGLSR